MGASRGCWMSSNWLNEILYRLRRVTPYGGPRDIERRDCEHGGINYIDYGTKDDHDARLEKVKAELERMRECIARYGNRSNNVGTYVITSEAAQEIFKEREKAQCNQKELK